MNAPAIVPKFCGACGSGLLDQARFCIRCGKRVIVAPISESAPPSLPAPEIAQQVVAGIYIAKAGFWRRSAAALIDLLLLTVVGLLFTVFGELIGGLLQIVLLYFPYFIAAETLWSGRTVGKHIFNLRACGADGAPLIFKQAVLRTIGRVLSMLVMGVLPLAFSIPMPLFWLIPPFVFVAGAIYYTQSEKPMPWDAMAKTTVVRDTPST